MKSRPLTLREINALQFDDGCTAKGTETKPQKRWRDPHTPLADKSVSPWASLLRTARKGDDKAADCLANCITKNAYEHAWFNKDRACIERGEGFVKELVMIALYRAIHGEGLTQRAAAARLGITLGPYQRNWEPRIAVIWDNWFKPRVRELDGD